MTYEIIYRNIKTLNDLAKIYNELKNKSQTNYVKKELNRVKIYMLSILKNIEDLTEQNAR